MSENKIRVFSGNSNRQLATDICNHLLADPRIPYVRVVMTTDGGSFPPLEGCDRQVFARLERPFRIADITECLNGTQWEDG